MTTLLRFAPSPTGALHLGGLRTALYNYLYARKTGGKWILRIEDTDRARTVPGAVEGIQSALEWAGLEYDHGPGKPGPHGPYFQSERLDLYHSYAEKLLDSGHAYRCFCAPDKLAATREKLARTGSNSTYDKSCLHLTEEEAARKVRAGEKFIIRLNDGKPPDRPTGYDLVFKNLKDAHQSLPTDPVLLKSDSFPTYHLASVVDDYEMGITHVVRGEEWLPSLPLHLDLYACLNLPMPQFAHLPILLNADGTKMSKRKGDVHVLDYKKRGWEPSSILNWLALAGWGVQDASASASHKQAPDSTTLMSMEEMIRNFDFSVLTHRRSVLDPVKLEYLNKHHLMRLMTTSDGLRTLAERTQPYVKKTYPDSPHHDLAYLGKVIFSLQGRTTKLSDIPALGPFFFVEPDYTSAEAQKMRQLLPNDNYAMVVESLVGRLRGLETAWETAALSEVLHDENAKTSLKQKEYMTILRHALTGMKTGPSVADVLYVLGPERSLARLQASKP
ncbi:glutamyl-tRNA synthetase [Trametes versicolor FP-101664 SS1]|uniref:glutamyl-tRNA synthetase n=1 Tax=Trametes versicolor (strain FP-101664) TaxID=717944 RepID=UPI0004624431|nr:glutamyl-tRNA synthetase [Trametes versicolor FP-101664 SS1]EIW65117.1 glutamyl-tRNA synthetase [Trametes versicolor FP-101664 SS1]